jgi:signal transduction histidine kinase
MAERMTDPAQPSEPRRLAEFIRGHATEALAEWERRARDLRPARRLERPTLLDHMPQFLEDLAAYIGELRAGHDVPPSSRYPRTHALERLDLGFDAREVVAEYAILREVLVELIRDKLAPAVRSAEMPRLHGAIDLAIAESIQQYTAARERTLRALNRISEAALDQADVLGFLDKLLTVLCETAQSVDVVKIMLREGEHLVVRAAVGLEADAAAQFRLRIGEGFAGRVASERSAMVLSINEENRAEVESEILRQRNALVLYGIPLLHRDDLVGVALMGSTTAYQFSDEDTLLFRTMANRATAIIVQGQLLERERIARAEAQKLAAALEVQEQELRTSLAFRDQMMGVLGHDLRNPLNVIRLSAQSLIARDDLPEGRVRIIKRILSNGERIDRMVHDLLDYTRARGGDFALKRASCALADIGREVVDAMETLHPARVFRFAAGGGDTEGEWDRDRIVRALSNLMTNAVNYGDQNGEVTLAVEGKGETVEVRVHNRGNPIPPEMQAQIFEPFTRAAESAADREGLGLGLFIVREIVHAHGGTIELASNAEQGTTFTVRLPRH